jgi:glutamine phosphoribosylpyrophosphate amidotransferase
MPRKEKENVAEMLAKAGIKPETLYNTAKKLDEDKKMYGGSNLELRRHAAGYLGNDIGNRFTYNDKGQIVIQFNGNFLTLEDIKKELGQSSAEVEKVKDSKKGKFFNRPKTLADYGY